MSLRNKGRRVVGNILVDKFFPSKIFPPMPAHLIFQLIVRLGFGCCACWEKVFFFLENMLSSKKLAQKIIDSKKLDDINNNGFNTCLYCIHSTNEYVFSLYLGREESRAGRRLGSWNRWNIFVGYFGKIQGQLQQTHTPPAGIFFSGERFGGQLRDGFKGQQKACFRLPYGAGYKR